MTMAKISAFLLSSLFALSLSTMAMGCKDDAPRDPDDLDDQLLVIDNDASVADNDAGVADSDDDVDQNDDSN